MSRASAPSTRIAQQNYSMALAQNQLARVDLITQQVRGLAISKELSEILIKYESEGIDRLSEVEHLRFQMWHMAIHYVLDSQHAQYTLGLLDEDSWMDAVRRIKEEAEAWDQLDLGIVARKAFAVEVARIRES